VKPSPEYIESRIETALGSGELTPEVQCAISVAKDLVKKAFNAGIAEGRKREKAKNKLHPLAGWVEEERQIPDVNKPACSMCYTANVPETGDVCGDCSKTWGGP
jgi:hypothetical protein